MQGSKGHMPSWFRQLLSHWHRPTVNRSYMVMILVAILGLGMHANASCPLTDDPLVAYIGHKVYGESTWSTAVWRDVLPGTKIYFHAMDRANPPQPITDLEDRDADLENCVQVTDTANYNWDWNWKSTEGSGKTGTVEGLAPDKTYNCAGDRAVRLYVYDNHTASGATDDVDEFDTIVVTVKLTLEMDSMADCGAGDHSIATDGLDEAWQRLGYTLYIDPDHDTSEHYEYLGADMNEEQIAAYLDMWENRGCLLYIMGAHRYAEHDMYMGITLRGHYSVVFKYFRGSILSTSEQADVAYHENGCHDVDVGSIDHCARNSTSCTGSIYTLDPVLMFCDDPANPGGADPDSTYCAPKLNAFRESHLDN